MATLVTITVVDDTLGQAPIADVLIQVYTTVGVFQTSGNTDGTGKISLLLPDATYILYFYKAGVSILPKQPQQIVVDSLQTSNDFTVTGHIKTAQESIDPLRCTVYGRVMGVDGKDTTHRLIFEPVKDLTVLSGNIVAPYSRIEIASDDTGYFEFELLRNTAYQAYFLFPQDIFSEQPGEVGVFTPDAAGVALADLLFPMPVSLTFSQASISVPRGGDDTSVTATAGFTDGTERASMATPWAYISLTNTDNTIADVAVSGTTLVITPHTPGTITVTATREVPDKVLFNPLPNFTSDTITITVT